MCVELTHIFCVICGSVFVGLPHTSFYSVAHYYKTMTVIIHLIIFTSIIDIIYYINLIYMHIIFS